MQAGNALSILYALNRIYNIKTAEDRHGIPYIN